MPLFHVSPAWLQPGSVIRPGNYGRIVNLVGAAHPRWNEEQVLEQVRVAQFPAKPSRLASAFVCADLVAARFFRDRNCPAGIVYEVDATDPNAIWHETDFNLITPPARSGLGSKPIKHATPASGPIPDIGQVDRFVRA